MCEGVPDDEIVWRLLKLQRRMNDEFERIAAEFNLTTAEAGALRRLAKPYSMRAFAAEIGCDASYVTLLTDRLEGLGFVERVADEFDRRVRQIVLTELGGRVRKELTDRVLATSPALVGLDDERRRTLVGLLRELESSVRPESDLHTGAVSEPVGTMK
jgi:MarR family transcriptional regulator, organic hydroperoxide resistance regulator